jgi:SAM-dependent methyltransferase
MRYFRSDRDYRFYFANFDTPSYALSEAPATIKAFSREEMYSTPLYQNVSAQVWAYGSELVDKTVLEMGCGPGMFGRLCSRFVKRYIGVDASTFALHIAEITSPESKCTYVHLGDVAALNGLAQVADTTVGRNFFIHHNYEDSLWILKFLRDVTKPGGLISADFYFQPESVGQARRYSARAPLDPDHASALYTFERIDIEEIAHAAELTLVESYARPDLERHFAVLKV